MSRTIWQFTMPCPESGRRICSKVYILIPFRELGLQCKNILVDLLIIEIAISFLSPSLPVSLIEDRRLPAFYIHRAGSLPRLFGVETFRSSAPKASHERVRLRHFFCSASLFRLYWALIGLMWETQKEPPSQGNAARMHSSTPPCLVDGRNFNPNFLWQSPAGWYCSIDHRRSNGGSAGDLIRKQR